MNFRIGQGYDVHKLVAGCDLIIGGVHIPFEYGLEGHSDADVLLHAMCDALLGAAGLGDIGKHFPPSEAKFAGMDSRIFVQQVNVLLQNRGWKIGNVDLTIVAEKPKMAPHIPEMEKNVGLDLDIAIEQVNIKATTTEGLGFCGTGQGISCHAVALIFREPPQ